MQSVPNHARRPITHTYNHADLTLIQRSQRVDKHDGQTVPVSSHRWPAAARPTNVFGRPFVKRLALRYRTVVCPVCLSVTLVYRGQTVACIKMKLDMEVGLGPGHTVIDGDPAPLPKKGHTDTTPNFRPIPIVAKRLDE